jgi:hypothetical protein
MQEATTMDQWNRSRPLQPDHAGLQRDAKNGDAKLDGEARRKAQLDDALERGLEDTFPGSDPVAVTQPPHSARDRLDARKR